MRRFLTGMASGPTTAGTKVAEERQICVYRGDALFSFIYRHQEQCTPVRVLLFYLCVFIGAKFALAAYSRVLWVPGLEQVVVADFHRYPPFSLLLMLGRFLKLTPVDIAPHAPNLAAVPYLRDYTEIFVMAVMAVQMVLIGRLWRNLSIALDQLYKDGVLAISKERWVQLSRKYDKLYNLRLARVAAMVGAIALILGIHYSAWVHGIYERLSASNDPTWTHVAYTNWWCNPASHPTLFIYSLAVAIFLCYYNLRNSIAGLITVFFCWETFSAGRGYEQVLILDTAHRDGLGGVGILKEMLSLAFKQVCISFVSLP